MQPGSLTNSPGGSICGVTAEETLCLICKYNPLTTIKTHTFIHTCTLHHTGETGSLFGHIQSGGEVGSQRAKTLVLLLLVVVIYLHIYIYLHILLLLKE